MLGKLEAGRISLELNQPDKADAYLEKLHVLVPDDVNEVAARSALGATGAIFHRVPFGDIWLRDTAPIFVRGEGGRVAAARFGFNGWGNKYVLEHDDAVAQRVADLAGYAQLAYPFVLEGGSVEVDGEGTILTTRQCLLNPNRNPSLPASTIEREVRAALGGEKVLWLGEGLLNDHTDGHIDTVARFVRPGVVVCMKPTGADDPNAAVLDAMAADLDGMTDASGRRLDVVRVPSPGRVLGNRIVRARQHLLHNLVIGIDLKRRLQRGKLRLPHRTHHLLHLQ